MPTLNFRKGTTVSGIQLYESKDFCGGTALRVRYHGAIYYADTTTTDDTGSGGGTGLRVGVPGQSSARAVAKQSTLQPFLYQAVNARHGFPCGQPAIGSTFQVSLSGTLVKDIVLKDFECLAVVIGVNHNKDLETPGQNSVTFGLMKNASGTKIAFFENTTGAKTSGTWFNMNNSATNSTGWNGCRMRQYIMPNFYNALPQEVRDVIITTKKWTYASNSSYRGWTDDQVFLMSEYEATGETAFSNASEQDYQRQYAWFAQGESRIFYKHNATSAAAAWYHRSPLKNDAMQFTISNVKGDTTTSSAQYIRAVVPCFNVG